MATPNLVASGAAIEAAALPPAEGLGACWHHMQAGGRRGGKPSIPVPTCFERASMRDAGLHREAA